MTQPAENIPADSPADNWVDLWAPPPARPYLRLMRADRPIGTWLLLLPCWFGMMLALGTAPNLQTIIVHPSPLSVLWYWFLFAIGAFVMRGAGCVYNDIVDSDIDAQVARTALRPIPAGDVTRRQAGLFLISLCLIGLIVLVQFNRTTIFLGIGSLALVAAYPFMKRITWWPQFWLGLTFNWGALVGYTAIRGMVEPATFALYGACIFWTLGYDTIYAHQDREDDAFIGVKSSARRLGAQTKPALIVFYSATILLVTIAIFLSNSNIVIPYLALLPIGTHFVWQIRTLNINDGHNCLRLFKSNRNAGFLLLFALMSMSVTRAVYQI